MRTVEAGLDTDAQVDVNGVKAQAHVPAEIARLGDDGASTGGDARFHVLAGQADGNCREFVKDS